MLTTRNSLTVKIKFFFDFQYLFYHLHNKVRMSLNIKNPHKFWSKKDIENAWNCGGDYTDIISNNISRKESQMKNTFLKVMKFLYKKELANTTSIHNDAEINWSSLKKSMGILLEKQIVSMNQHHDKQNNEKLFSLNKNRAIVYGDHLVNYKMNLSNWKKHKGRTREHYKRLKKSPENFLDWRVYFTPETAKKKRIKYQSVRDLFSKKNNKTKNEGVYIQIKNLSYKEIDIIFRDFYNNHYCATCYDKSQKILITKSIQSLAEDYRQKYSGSKDVDANKFKTSLLTEVKEIGDVIQCTRCKIVQSKNDEASAKLKGEKETTLGSFESELTFQDLIAKEKKFNRV